MNGYVDEGTDGLRTRRFDPLTVLVAEYAYPHIAASQLVHATPHKITSGGVLFHDRQTKIL